MFPIHCLGSVSRNDRLSALRLHYPSIAFTQAYRSNFPNLYSKIGLTHHLSDTGTNIRTQNLSIDP